MTDKLLNYANLFTLSVASFFDKIDEKYFTPDFDTYETLTFFNDPTAFKWTVLCIYFGLIMASLIMYYNKHLLGGFIRKLDSENCISNETAKSLSELGYSKNIFVKLSLKAGYSLRRVVSYAADNSQAGLNNGSSSAISRSGGNLLKASMNKEKLCLDKDKFYIPESSRISVLQRFHAKGSSLMNVALLAVIGLVFILLIMRFAPYLVGLIDSAISGTSNSI